ncbi:hypothetical protein D9758_007613 [Tetrapyrgos nigripes]|uniref:Cytochrome P450 n=1 Tax=Tetrapyrgos nigripes TaxID=182062 RepID=A0A8H5LK49_9AGAR|nr:hypothetical protein D9758_007613 [Tetrapyrgos nigripes]
MPSFTTWIVLAICAGFLWAQSRRSRGFPLSPGPKRWPIVGNAFQMPRYHEFLTFTEWKETWVNDVNQATPSLLIVTKLVSPTTNVYLQARLTPPMCFSHLNIAHIMHGTFKI